MSNLLTGGDNTEGVVRRTLTLSHEALPLRRLHTGYVATIGNGAGTRVRQSASDTSTGASNRPGTHRIIVPSKYVIDRGANHL